MYKNKEHSVRMEQINPNSVCDLLKFFFIIFSSALNINEKMRSHKPYWDKKNRGFFFV